jgi:putative alpha-1,2-mannosidase
MLFSLQDDADVEPFVVVQATRELVAGEISIDPQAREVSGWNPERQDKDLGPFAAKDFRGYFVARFDTDFSAYGIAHGADLTPDARFGEGEALSAYVQFPPNAAASVGVRVGVSYISIEQARQNLLNEIPDGTSLEETAKAVEAQWAEKLDRVQITNATEDQLAIFYTSMYHALQVTNRVCKQEAVLNISIIEN